MVDKKQKAPKHSIFGDNHKNALNSTMRTAKQKTKSYAETGSDFDDSDFGSEEEIEVEEGYGDDFEIDDEEDDEEENNDDVDEEDEEEFYQDEIDDEDNEMKTTRGKYKQPGVKIMKQTSRQMQIRLRFADKFLYESLFSDTPIERAEEEEGEGEGEGEEEGEEDEEEEEGEEEEEEEETEEVKNEVGESDSDGKKIPKSVLQLLDPRTKTQKLSEEELQIKKAEAARKRKHFISRKLEAEKRETLERLLMKRESKQKSASVGPDSDGLRKEYKTKTLLKHKALFSWCSKTEESEGIKKDVPSYSVII